MRKEGETSQNIKRVQGKNQLIKRGSLLRESIEELVGNLKSGEGLSEVIVRMSLEVGRSFCKQVLELLDDYIFHERDKKLKVERIRPRWVIFSLGSIRIKRRQYIDREGRRRYLLDEYLGLEGKSPLTPEIKESSIFLTTLLPFMKCAAVMEKSLPQAAVSHTTLHRTVSKVTLPWLQAEESRKQQIYETGELPEGEERKVSHLMVEADGVNIALQREKQSKAEIKVGIAYEGWEEVSKGRYRLTGKTSYCALTSGSSFWEGFSLQLATKYDLTSTGNIVVGGDGARWVKDGVDLLGGCFQLDRFHLLRALRRSLSWQTHLIEPIYSACNEGDWLRARSLLIQGLNQASGNEKDEIQRVIRYLGDNVAGLMDYRLKEDRECTHLRRTGAIESNVDKLIANRMKKKGMSWTIKGAKHMACLLMLTAERKLTDICQPVRVKTTIIASSKKARHVLVKNIVELEGKWLQATIPALYGPHQGRHWVKSLKHLSEVSFNV